MYYAEEKGAFSFRAHDFIKGWSIIKHFKNVYNDPRVPLNEIACRPMGPTIWKA